MNKARLTRKHLVESIKSLTRAGAATFPPYPFSASMAISGGI